MKKNFYQKAVLTSLKGALRTRYS